jgi:hypothetical protein
MRTMHCKRKIMHSSTILNLSIRRTCLYVLPPNYSTDFGESFFKSLPYRSSGCSYACKDKSIPVTGRGGPYGGETSKLPYFFYKIGSQMTVRLSALRAGRPLPLGRFLVLISVTGWIDPRATVRLEGLRQLKNPTAPSEIEPATFQIVA